MEMCIRDRQCADRGCGSKRKCHCAHLALEEGKMCIRDSDKGSLVDYQRFRSKFHSGECGHDKKSKEHPDKACARRCRAVQFHHFNQWPNKPPQYARRQNLQYC